MAEAGEVQEDRQCPAAEMERIEGLGTMHRRTALVQSWFAFLAAAVALTACSFAPIPSGLAAATVLEGKDAFAAERGSSRESSRPATILRAVRRYSNCEDASDYPRLTGPSLCDRVSRNCSLHRSDFAAADPSATQ